MQALWRTLRNPSDQIAHVAFRVLGKFGGGNRKMMIEPQALEYCGAAENEKSEKEDPGELVTESREKDVVTHKEISKSQRTATFLFKQAEI